MANYRIFGSTTGIPTASGEDPAGVNLGVEFSVSTTCWITSVLWWQATTGTDVNTDPRTIALYRLGSTPILVASHSGHVPSGTGWQTASFAAALKLTAGTRYKAVVFHPSGGYTSTGDYYGSGAGQNGLTNGPLTFHANSDTAAGQNTYVYGSALAFPGSTYQSANYWLDVIVTDVKPPNSPPTADAGVDQTVQATYTAAGVRGPVITLDGSASTDPDGSLTAYSWTQLSGSAVTLSSTSVAQPTFTPPRFGGVFTFALTVTDDDSASSAQDTVQITVRSVPYGYIRSGGVWVKRPLFVRRGGAWS